MPVVEVSRDTVPDSSTNIVELPRDTQPDDVSFLDQVKDLFTGESRIDKDLPELGTSGPSVPPFSSAGLKMMGVSAMSPDPEAIADVALKVLPGATRKTDRHGNAIINFEGQDYFVNRPGLSGADMFGLLGQIAAFTPAARVGAARSTIPRRIATTGPLTGATSIGLDLGAGALGSEQGVDLTRAGIAAGAGGALEAVAPLVSAAASRVVDIIRRRGLFDRATGKLTAEGRKVAEAADLNPDELSSEFSEAFAREAREATDPAHAVPLAESEEFSVRLTRGQTTGDINQIRNEEAARQGAFGEEAGGIIRSFDDRQADDIVAATDRIQDRFARGKSTIAQERQGADVIGEGLRREERALSDRIDAAYDAVRETDARLNVQSLSSFTKRIRKATENFDIDKDLTPAAVKALRRIGRLAKDVAKGGKVTKLTLRRLESERKRLGSLIEAASNRTDRAIVVRIKRELDGFLDDAFDNALFEGDQEALALLKEARSLRLSKGRKFEPRGPGDDAGKAVQKMLAEERTPEEITNFIFGLGQLGNKLGSANIVKRLKNIFGVDSEEFGALREMAWLRMTQAKGGRVTPAKFQTAINTALAKNRSLMDELFDSQEIALMKRFRNLVGRIITPKDAINPSRSAFTAATLMRQFLRRGGTMATFRGEPGLGALLFGLARLPTPAGFLSAARAVRPLPRPLPSAPVLPATGAAAGSRATQEFQSPSQ